MCIISVAKKTHHVNMGLKRQQAMGHPECSSGHQVPGLAYGAPPHCRNVVAVSSRSGGMRGGSSSGVGSHWLGGRPITIDTIIVADVVGVVIHLLLLPAGRCPQARMPWRLCGLLQYSCPPGLPPPSSRSERRTRKGGSGGLCRAAGFVVLAWEPDAASFPRGR